MTESPSVGCPAPCCDREPREHAGRADLLGLTCSLACAVHCAAMPLVISAHLWNLLAASRPRPLASRFPPETASLAA